ncbi:MAG: RNA polymerase sigma factor [Bacteroidetes bacterium]|nr:RNA polymerase sigma factor [Bacteroidota bacterium]
MLPEELLLLTSQGDKNAFRQLYEMFNSRVYNTCLYYLQHVPDAEEITQDVFIEVYHSSAKFRGGSSVSTWIYRVTVNKCLDKLRYNNRQKRFAFVSSIFNRDTGALQHDKPDFNHPGISLENKEKAGIVLNAIRQLPENQQTAFILKQVEGVSQKEISAIMDLSEKAVESLLQRAKANLRKILGDFYNQNEGLDNN